MDEVVAKQPADKHIHVILDKLSTHNTEIIPVEHSLWGQVYLRHGRLSIMAALDLHTGQIIANVEQHHRSVEFIALLRRLGACRAWGAESEIGPSERIFCRIRRPIAGLWGKKTVKKPPLRSICSRQLPSPTGS